MKKIFILLSILLFSGSVCATPLQSHDRNQFFRDMMNPPVAQASSKFPLLNGVNRLSKKKAPAIRFLVLPNYERITQKFETIGIYEQGRFVRAPDYIGTLEQEILATENGERRNDPFNGALDP